MIVLDTSALVDSLAGPRRSGSTLRGVIEEGHRIAIPALVLYEWRRGPRIPEELAAQEALLPSELSLSFGADEAGIAADLYRVVSQPRRRSMDLAIAATALAHGAPLWTLNRADFLDIPGLEIFAGP